MERGGGGAALAQGEGVMNASMLNAEVFQDLRQLGSELLEPVHSQPHK